MIHAAAAVLAELRAAERDLQDVRQGRTRYCGSPRSAARTTRGYRRSYGASVSGAPASSCASKSSRTRTRSRRYFTDRIDVGLVTKGDRRSEAVCIQPLFEDEMVAIVPVEHHWAGRPFVEAPDFEGSTSSSSTATTRRGCRHCHCRSQRAASRRGSPPHPWCPSWSSSWSSPGRASRCCRAGWPSRTPTAAGSSLSASRGRRRSAPGRVRGAEVTSRRTSRSSSRPFNTTSGTAGSRHSPDPPAFACTTVRISAASDPRLHALLTSAIYVF